jgi:PKD repeat protein
LYATGLKSVNTTNSDLEVLKVDFDGNVIWRSTWGGPEKEKGYSIWGDGNYLYVSGYTRSYDAQIEDFLIQKWDLNGNLLLNETWGGSALDILWSIWGDGNFIYTSGATMSFGPGTVSHIIEKWDLNLLPNASFDQNATSIYLNQSIQFTYNGTDGDPTTTFQWNFTDGSANSTERNPEHSFPTPGTYTIKLLVTDGNGDNSTYSEQITVLDLTPTANFTANATTTGINQDLQFTYTGLGGDNPLSFDWNFGDGTGNSTDRNPVHSFTTLGIKTVKLHVSDKDGDNSTYELNITVIDLLPTASFSVGTPLHLGVAIAFTITGSQGDPSATYQWNFGDGTANSTVSSPSHTFAAAGTYTVKLLVTDVDGDKAFAQQTVNITDPSATTTTTTTDTSTTTSSSTTSSSSSSSSSTSTNTTSSGDGESFLDTYMLYLVIGGAVVGGGLIIVIVKKKKADPWA